MHDASVRRPHPHPWWLATFLALCGLMSAACGEDAAPGEDATAVEDTASSDTANAGDTATADTLHLDTAAEVDAADAADVPEVEEDTAADTSGVDTGSPDAEPGDTTPSDTAPEDVGPEDVAPPARAPLAGELLITELMINPDGVSDLVGEWIEVENLAGVALDLRSCALDDGAGQSADLAHAVGDPVVVAAGLHVLGRSRDPAVNGGAPVDLAYDGLLMPNARGAIRLACGGSEIDRVDYDRETWVMWPGASLSLSADAPRTVEANVDPERWCEGRTAFGTGDLGTPGAPNPACPPRPTQVTWCEVASPLAANALAGEPVAATADLFIEGATDLTAGIDRLYFLRAEGGFGPPGSHPDDGGWAWWPAEGLEGWEDPAVDRYGVTLEGLADGVHAVAFRFSLDAGETWTLCDAATGEGPFDPEATGLVTVSPSPCLPNPCDSPPEARCEGDEAVTHAESGSCAVVHGIPLSAACTYAEMRRDCALLSGACAGGECVGEAAWPGAGEVMVNEIMRNPLGATALLGEWFELRNVAAHTVRLDGCVIRDDNLDHHVITTDLPLLLGAGQEIVLGRNANPSQNGGVPVAYAYGNSMALHNTNDQIALECGDVLVDRVAYTFPAFPSGVGRSLNLDPRRAATEGNDVPGSWCLAELHWLEGSPDRGTPGAPNHACPKPPDRCRLVPPATWERLDGEPFLVFGQLREVGITDRSAGTDVDPLVRFEAGYGPRATPPTDATWVWTPGEPDLAWLDGAAPGEDQYFAELVAPDDPGVWDVAVRFSVDGGLTWTPCDLPTGTPGEDGSENGFQSDNAGTLVVSLASACNPNPCVDPGPTTCDGDVKVSEALVGECTLVGPDLEGASCHYPPQLTDCAALGGACVSGECEGVARRPLPGEVLFTEIMARPAAVADFYGEWLEVQSVGGEVLSLAGCALRDDDAVRHTIAPASGGLLLAPGDTVLLARHGDPLLNGGLAPDYVWGPGLALANHSDAVVLACDGAMVDRLSYGPGALPPVAGVAWQLSLPLTDAGESDRPESWCLATEHYGAGDLGTPGQPNAPCPRPVDRCRFQAPAEATLAPGAVYEASMRLVLAGVTDRTPWTDAALGVRVELGVGPPGTHPLEDDAWMFTPAEPDLHWEDWVELDWDQWIGAIPAPSPGTWAVAFRASADGGHTWTACDRATGAFGEDGSEDGYQPDNAGVLVVTEP